MKILGLGFKTTKFNEADSLPKGKIEIVYDDSGESETLKSSQLEELRRCSNAKYGNKEYYYKSSIKIK